MGYVEVFQMDNEGAGWVALGDLPAADLFDIEATMLLAPLTIRAACHVCYAPLTAGQGNCCDAHASVKGSIRF